jgi:hypothetical protein
MAQIEPNLQYNVRLVHIAGKMEQSQRGFVSDSKNVQTRDVAPEQDLASD